MVRYKGKTLSSQALFLLTFNFAPHFLSRQVLQGR